MTQNQWIHVAVVRGANGSITLYQNGTSVATGTITASITASSYNVTVGVDNAGDESTFTGYIADIRVTKAALYVEAFTAPATTATNTASGYSVLSNSVYGIYQLS